jgi:hypothetical protein
VLAGVAVDSAAGLRFAGCYVGDTHGNSPGKLCQSSD